MSKTMNISVTFRNADAVRTVHTTIESSRLTAYLNNLDMDTVTAIAYGDAVKSEPTVIKPMDIDLRLSGDAFHIDMHTADNKRVATAKFTPIQLNDFGMRLIQQAHYEFRAMAHRLEGLDK